ncbi:MAG TPA: sigma-70 family RNA polymerase sigma factor [Candidatus Anammoximicrobium sp.]|nr:sigma-70 family RNA polymerase sigma factor [Candidatus Anammoximicrobium sp.]
MVEQDSDITRLRTGGQQALADALALHAERLQRIVDLRLDPRLTGRVDAADVLQEAFLEGCKRLPRYLDDPRVSVFVWLRGVTLDTLIHVHRRHLAEMRDAGREVSLHGGPAPPATSLSLAGCLAADLTSPSQAAIREETARKIEKVLGAMDEIDREVLILRHFEQLSNDEVASVIGVKKAAASRRYMRALARFREVVETVPGCDFGV